LAQIFGLEAGTYDGNISNTVWFAGHRYPMTMAQRLLYLKCLFL
jgi:hypothetical protein